MCVNNNWKLLNVWIRVYYDKFVIQVYNRKFIIKTDQAITGLPSQANLLIHFLRSLFFLRSRLKNNVGDPVQAAHWRSTGE